MTPEPPDEILPEGVDLYDFDDYPTQRRLLFDSVRSSVSEQFPLEYKDVRLEVQDVDYEGPEEYSLAEQRDAIMNDKYLTRKLRGTLRLIDTTTGEPLEERRTTLMKVPYLTDRGTFIHKGNEIASIRQGRLLAGPYARRQDNGNLEVQWNPRVGTGKSFRVGLEPQTAQYKIKIGGSNLHLYSLLKDLGTSDEELESSWGPRVLEMNRKKYDIRTLDKAYDKLLNEYKRVPGASREDKAAAVREAIEAVQYNRRVVERNLPNWRDRVKAASWREQGDALDSRVETMVKRANFTAQEVDELAMFLASEHGAQIPQEGTKGDKEEAIINFIRGNPMALNVPVSEAGQQGLANVQRDNPDLPRMTVPQVI